MTAPQPMLLRLERLVELQVFADADDSGVVLQFDRPAAGPEAPLFSTKLTIEDTVSLVDRLVHTIGEIKGAGPLSSTY